MTSNNNNTTESHCQDRYKLIFYVPTTDAEKCKEAVFATGAGTIGQYSKCCFQTKGTGQFLPSDTANPTIGAQGELESVEEIKAETLCFGREMTIKAVGELIKAHPYEEVVYEVYKLEDI